MRISKRRISKYQNTTVWIFRRFQPPLVQTFGSKEMKILFICELAQKLKREGKLKHVSEVGFLRIPVNNEENIINEVVKV